MRAHARARAHLGLQRDSTVVGPDQGDFELLAELESALGLDQHQVQAAGFELDLLAGRNDQLIKPAHSHDAIVHDHGMELDMPKLRAFGIDQDHILGARVGDGQETGHHPARRRLRRPGVVDLQVLGRQQRQADQAQHNNQKHSVHAGIIARFDRAYMIGQLGRECIDGYQFLAPAGVVWVLSPTHPP